MLDNLNSQNFDPELYMDDLEEILDAKIELILDVKKQIRQIKKQLKSEKQLNQQFQTLKNQQLNIFEIKNQPGLFNHYQL